mmetsp:Transcript_28940/g.74397  ORF Transcript_28940/g.74397 Transcript_28940/m.74397 type:complete len:218 (-) Transcript_28940:90-743(-)
MCNLLPISSVSAARKDAGGGRFFFRLVAARTHAPASSCALPPASLPSSPLDCRRICSVALARRSSRSSSSSASLAASREKREAAGGAIGGAAVRLSGSMVDRKLTPALYRDGGATREGGGRMCAGSSVPESAGWRCGGCAAGSSGGRRCAGMSWTCGAASGVEPMEGSVSACFGGGTRTSDAVMPKISRRLSACCGNVPTGSTPIVSLAWRRMPPMG